MRKAATQVATNAEPHAVRRLSVIVPDKGAMTTQTASAPTDRKSAKPTKIEDFDED